MDLNQIVVFDIVIKQIHIALLQVAVTALLGLGLLRLVSEWYKNRKGAAFDRFSISRTIVRPIEFDRGLRIALRNIGIVRRFDDMVRGVHMRKKIIVAGGRCTLEQQFVILDTDKDQEAMLEAVRNAITWTSQEGEIAEVAGHQVVTTNIFFALTAADTSGETVQTFRVSFDDEKTLRHFLKKDAVWKFEDERSPQLQRVKTLARVADAHFNHNGCINYNGRMVKIVGWMELKTKV